MRRPLKNVAASVHARLLREARRRGQEMQRALVLYCFERFLYRLGRSELSDRFVLKGAMLFRLWDGELARATRDLDLLGLGESSEEANLEAIRLIWKTRGVEDGLELERDSLTAHTIRGRTALGVRSRFRVRLGEARLALQVDIGFGDSLEPPAETVDFPTLLDLPAPRILAYPKEAVVAEKVHVMAVRGLSNSRLKDYFDLDHLARTQSFDWRRLRVALGETFRRRGTPIPDGRLDGLSPAFSNSPAKRIQWAAFLRRTGIGGEELPVVVARIAELVEPTLDALALDAAFIHRWQPGGPWETSPRPSHDA